MSEDSYIEQVARGLIKLSTSTTRAIATVVAEILIVIIDHSGSMASPCGRDNRLETTKRAVIALLDAREKHGAADQLAVIAFNHKARLVLPFTECMGYRNHIERAIRSISISGGTDLKTIPYQGPEDFAVRWVRAHRDAHGRAWR